MRAGTTWFAQVMEFVPWTLFARIVHRYPGSAGAPVPVKHTPRSG
jgi:hypothetical protein